MCLFFFTQKTAYEMRISDWSSDVCSSDLTVDSLTFKSINLYGDYGAIGSVDQPLALTATGGPIAVNISYGDMFLGDVSSEASGIGDQDASIPIGSATCRERVCQSV